MCSITFKLNYPSSRYVIHLGFDKHSNKQTQIQTNTHIWAEKKFKPSSINT